MKKISHIFKSKMRALIFRIGVTVKETEIIRIRYCLYLRGRFHAHAQ